MSAALDDLDTLLRIQDDVLNHQQAAAFLSPAAIREQLRTERWRRTHRTVYLTSPEPATRLQRCWTAVLAAGQDDDGTPRGLLGGRAALEVLGLRGFAGDAIDVVLRRQNRYPDPPSYVRVHRSRRFEPDESATDTEPPCTSAARS